MLVLTSWSHGYTLDVVTSKPESPRPSPSTESLSSLHGLPVSAWMEQFSHNFLEINGVFFPLESSTVLSPTLWGCVQLPSACCIVPAKSCCYLWNREIAIRTFWYNMHDDTSRMIIQNYLCVIIALMGQLVLVIERNSTINMLAFDFTSYKCFHSLICHQCCLFISWSLRF